MNSSYNKYQSQLRRLADVLFSSAVLQWDQETYMPEKGNGGRSSQIATLAGIAHEMSIADDLGKLLLELEKDASLSFEQRKNIEISSKDYKDRKKYTTAFVEQMTKAISESFSAWQSAKKNNDFTTFAPYLEKVLDFKRKEADLLGYADHPYDALVDQYEPRMTVKELDVLFAEVKSELTPFVRELASKTPNRDEFMYRHFDGQKQWDFGLEVLRSMGYDFSAGRQDRSEHPFTVHFNSGDVRVTTRVVEDNLHEMIWSTIHEGGHALYEQGIPSSEYGLPSGEAASLSVHESQSRLWENNVGRGKSFWKHFYPVLQSYFKDELKDVSLDEFYKAMNQVKPSLIRTNADELTYHFHVLIRYEIEKKLIEGTLKVKDLPEFWNSSYKEYLGIEVPNDTQGVLQDVHWSHGSFGYFPTYSLGSFYAAQYYAAASKAIPDLEEKICKGQLTDILKWLRENIHRHGKTYNAQELCQRVTGSKLQFSFFMEYALKKYAEIY